MPVFELGSDADPVEMRGRVAQGKVEVLIPLLSIRLGGCRLTKT